MKKLISTAAAAVIALSNAAVFLNADDRSSNISVPLAYAAEDSVNQIISRGVPTYSGKSNSASAGNDDKYYTFWSASAGDYLAYDLSGVPQSKRKKVLAVWYNLSSYDNIGLYVSRSAEPIDYTIEVNKAPGGSYPSSGWEVAEIVTDNGYSSRQHIVDMEGYNWIRMNVSKALGDNITLNLDIHDVSDGVFDSWIFFGDSITAGGMVNAYGTSYAAYVNQIDSRFFPAQENGGIGGITSRDGKEHIDQWLSVCNAHFVSIAYGTNDCWGNPNNVQNYYNNTKYMIDAILTAGKVPVLPKIPSSTNPDVGSNTDYYNAMVDKLYSEYGDKLVHGPDFDKFFKENTWALSADGVHPSSEGYEEMKKLWAETMYENVYKKMDVLSPAADIIEGDVNADGKFNLADVVTLQKWLLDSRTTELKQWQAGDLCEDRKIDTFDLTMMRMLLVPGEEY
ncbi:MAG TPA: GDSL-type esterase/lipase family protein [Ruminococcus sp.]|nr:GDSL-type esterase/lipase family protein [Ruminococcus sp.]